MSDPILRCDCCGFPREDPRHGKLCPECFAAFIEDIFDEDGPDDTPRDRGDEPHRLGYDPADFPETW